MGPYHI